MTQAIFTARGNGYAGCTAFDGFEVIAAPMAERESRIFGQFDGKAGTGTDYRSHEIKLAVRTDATPYKEGRQLYILMSHGGGREVLRIPTFYDRGNLERALIAMPEAAQYALLYTLFQTARDAATVAREETALRYGHAFLEGRMKKTRKRGVISLKIETGWQGTINGETFSPTSCKSPDAAMTAAKAEAERRGLTDAKIGAIGRS